MSQSPLKDHVTWAPAPWIRPAWLQWGVLLVVVGYVILAGSTLDVNWERIVAGGERTIRMMSDFVRPDFTARQTDVWNGILESLVMTVVASVVGFVVSIPIGFGAARTISPLPIYVLCRGIITLARTFQEVIIAILFVIMVGFGPLAGVLTLSFTTIGFLAKLLAEKIEEIDPAPLEAIRATGASWLQLMDYGVLPQIMPRLIGLTIYRFDINLRESAIVGIVGAGGIGATLETTFDRYEFRTAGAILIVIIGPVMLTEWSSTLIRKRLL